MEERDVIKPETQHKVVWLVKGIALRDITLQAVKLEQAHLAHHLVSWHQGNTPANIPWVVARTKSDKVKLRLNHLRNLTPRSRRGSWSCTVA